MWGLLLERIGRSGRRVGILLAGVVVAVGVGSWTATEGVGDGHTESGAGGAANTAQLLLHSRGSVFERVPDKFPINIFFPAVVELQRASVLRAAHSSEKAA